MAGKKRNSSFEILTAMQDLNTPAGALQLAQILHLPSASIGRELLELEKAGLLVKVQNKGRILTPQGERFLEEERSRVDGDRKRAGGYSFGAETPGGICGGGMCRAD